MVDVFSDICTSGPFFLVFFIVNVAIRFFLLLFLELLFSCFYYVVVLIVVVKYNWDDFSAFLYLLFQI